MGKAILEKLWKEPIALPAIRSLLDPETTRRWLTELERSLSEQLEDPQFMKNFADIGDVPIEVAEIHTIKDRADVRRDLRGRDKATERYEVIATNILRALERYLQERRREARSSDASNSGVSDEPYVPFLQPEEIVSWLIIRADSLLRPLVRLQPKERRTVIQLIADTVGKFAVNAWESEHNKISNRTRVIRDVSERFVGRIRLMFGKNYRIE